MKIPNAKFKTCIVMPCREYRQLLQSLLGADIIVDFSPYGIWVGYEDPEREVPDVYVKLAEYFEVAEITDVRICPSSAQQHLRYHQKKEKAGNGLNVWICYKDSDKDSADNKPKHQVTFRVHWQVFSDVTVDLPNDIAADDTDAIESFIRGEWDEMSLPEQAEYLPYSDEIDFVYGYTITTKENNHERV